MFTQRRLLTEFQFDLTPVDVRVREKGLTVSKSYRVPYENVPGEPITVSISSRPRLVVTIVLLILAAFTGVDELMDGDVDQGAWALYGTLALFAAGWFALSRTSYLVFRAAEPALVVMANRPTPEAVATFLTSLHQHRLAYLRQQYLTNAPSAEVADTIQKLYWLRQQGAISEQEYATLKARAVGGADEPPLPPAPLH